MSEVTYSKKNDEIECVRYKKSQKIYLPHTHPNHMTIGYIEEGRVCITIDGESCIYEPGEEFRIMPNVLHEIKPVDEKPYSMMVMCIKTDAVGKLYRKIFLFKRRWEIYCEKKIFYSGYGWHCVSVLGFL